MRFYAGPMADIQKYSPTQPRDDRGRFASTAGGGGGRPYFRGQMVSDIREPDGGFTYDPRSGTAVTSGYAVSPYPERSRSIDINHMTDRDLGNAIRQYERDNVDLLKTDTHMLGGWHDPATGTGYLDVSIVVDSAAEAARIGRERDQIAYFDLQTFQSVDIDRMATSGGQATR